MQQLLDRTKDTLKYLSSCLDDFNPKKISALDNLYNYKDVAKGYSSYLDSLTLEGDEKLFVDFWYKGNLMSVRSFIPDVDYLLNNVRKLRSMIYRDKERALVDLYSDTDKSFSLSILANDLRLRCAAALIHRKVIPDEQARQLAGKLAAPLIRLGYKGKINPGRDLYSVRDRLDLLQAYTELIEESVSIYGVTDINPALIRARLDSKQ